jgi:hypothetical protein
MALRKPPASFPEDQTAPGNPDYNPNLACVYVLRPSLIMH